MKKIISLFLFILISSLNFAQTKITKKLLAEINGQWQVDGSGRVTYNRVIDVGDLSEDLVFERVLGYFALNPANKKSLIPMQDKALRRIVALGVYENVNTEYTMHEIRTDCGYIVNINVTEGKGFIKLTLLEYSREFAEADLMERNLTEKVEDCFPVNPKGNQKNLMTEIFYNSHKSAMATLVAIGNSIMEVSDNNINNDN